MLHSIDSMPRMPRPSFRPVLRALSLLSFFAGPLFADETLTEGWRDAGRHLFKESAARFASRTDREGRLGGAALLLLQQPKTDANLAQAETTLTDLAATATGPGDEIAAAALYLLGRLEQNHRSPGDPVKATAHYRRLLAEHPGHFFADQAYIKIAQIEIYDPALASDERLARIDRHAAIADTLSRPGSRRDLHLVLAQACSQLRLDDARALRHYLAADAAGIKLPQLQANVTVAIGELASRLGQPDLARIHFERFLADFRRDYRRSLVRDKLAALPPLSAR